MLQKCGSLHKSKISFDLRALECHLQEICISKVEVKNAGTDASCYPTYTDPNIQISLGHVITTKEIILGNSLETFVIKKCLSNNIRYKLFCLS